MAFHCTFSAVVQVLMHKKTGIFLSRCLDCMTPNIFNDTRKTSAFFQSINCTYNTEKIVLNNKKGDYEVDTTFTVFLRYFFLSRIIVSYINHRTGFGVMKAMELSSSAISIAVSKASRQSINFSGQKTQLYFVIVLKKYPQTKKKVYSRFFPEVLRYCHQEAVTLGNIITTSILQV